MKILSTLVFFLISYSTIAQVWQRIQDFPGTARDDGSTFTINNKTYCGIGLEVGWTCPNDFYVFDLNTETWTTYTSFPTNQQRQYATSFVINGKGYVFGGYNCSNNYLNDLWEYSPATNNWLQKNNLPSFGRSGCVSFVINDTAYIVGGRTATLNAVTDVWGYDAVNNSWFQKNDLPNKGIWRGVSFSYNNQGFVGLGKDSLDGFNKKIYKYDHNTWSIINDYTHLGRAYTGYTQNDSTAYLFGGIDSLNVIDSTFEILKLKNFASQNLDAFPDTPRKGCMMFCNNNKVYITTGVSSTTRFNETWKIDIASNIKEHALNNLVHLCPNPNNGNFYLDSKTYLISKVKIFNPLGELVYENQFEKQFINIDLQQLSKGFYTVYYELNNKSTYNQKLIIE